MRKHLQGIDHVVIAVGDIAQAAATYRRLGFTLTPHGRHTMGSENHCVMFERDYFELLSVPVAHPVTRYYQDFLREGEGLAALALATDDARGFHAELTADGIAADAPVDFSRPVQLAHGTFDASFRITQLAAEATPAGRVFACQHFTREVVWRPEYLQHPNAVTALGRVVAVADAAQLKTLAERYASIFAVAPRPGSIGGAPSFDVETGNTPLSFTTTAGLAQLLPGVGVVTRPQPCFAALYFRSANLAATREVLRANGVPCVAPSPQALAVSPEHANGVALVFTE
jgi:catechol 2,3-dioxygenase-like lactoylglutathione lyase family enzyme